MTWKPVQMAGGMYRVAHLAGGVATYHQEDGAPWQAETKQAATRKAALLNCGGSPRRAITQDAIDAALPKLNLQPRTVRALRLVASGHTWKSAASSTGVTESGMLRAMRRIAVHLMS